MSEEVTYATLKFSNPKTKEPQESYSLERTGKILLEDQKTREEVISYTGGFSCLQFKAVSPF